MLKKFIFKLIKHITNPLESLYFDVRKIYWLYAKIYLTYLKKIKFPETSFLCPIDYIDLLNLWKNIIKRKPNVILEIGSGYSTFVIIAAINELNSLNNIRVKKFYSLEQNEQYLDDMKKFMSKEYLDKVNFILTDLKMEKIHDTEVTTCSNFPKDKINFIYEDRSDHPIYKIAGDALKIEENMPEDYFICVDGMTETVNFYKKFLKRKYKYSGGKFSGSNFEPINYSQ